MAEGRLIFVTGTDTGVGKSYATGLMARAYLELGVKVITAKPVQTGTREPEDLLLHRRLMGLPPDPPELLDLTCPYIFEYPAAPATAAEREGRVIDLARILSALRELTRRYEIVLVEGAGGLFVPFTPEYTLLDLMNLVLAPVVVVSAARLGTINHTVLTLEALKARSLYVAALIYNHYFASDEWLARKSLEDIQRLAGPQAVFHLKDLSRGPDGLSELKAFLKATVGLRP